MKRQDMKQNLTLQVNGIGYDISVEPRKTLADALRDECGLTGTHLGCEHGVCGACTIIADGAPIRACLMFAVQAEGLQLRTVEVWVAERYASPLAPRRLTFSKTDRLLEYQKYQDAARQLEDRDQLGRDVFARRPPSLAELEAMVPGLRGVSIF
jgi:succinate dehydrogenase/fumarate reductase-like Fe-S protein